MKVILRFLIWLAALLGGAACLTAALAGQAGRWSDRYDLINHISPFLMLGGLLAAGVCLAAATGWARWFGAAVGALAVVAAGLQTAPVLAQAAWQPAAALAIPNEAPRLKLVQFSVYHANPNPSAAVDWLLGQQADILVLEEVEGLDAPARARLFDAYPYRSDHGDLILSRLPIRSDGRFDREPRPTRMFFLGGYAEIDGPGGPFTVVGVHFTWPWPVRFQARQRQEFARYISTLPSDSTIVAGDLNSTPWSFALARLERGMGLRRVIHGVPTFPARAYQGTGDLNRASRLPALFAFAPIDQVFAGSAWRTVSVRRGPKLGSDHYPLVVVLARVG